MWLVGAARSFGERTSWCPWQSAHVGAILSPLASACPWRLAACAAPSLSWHFAQATRSTSFLCAPFEPERSSWQSVQPTPACTLAFHRASSTNIETLCPSLTAFKSLSLWHSMQAASSSARAGRAQRAAHARSTRNADESVARVRNGRMVFAMIAMRHARE
jgi:hypothetical protein